MGKRFYILFFFGISVLLNSQTNDSLKNSELENYFAFNYDNDLFSQTDRYYTQGISVDLVLPFVKHSPLSYILLKLNGAKNYYGLRLQQDVYTPKSIEYMGGKIYEGERPYTATFFISHTLHSLNSDKKILLKSHVDLGILGPEAKGEEEQKAIHKATNNAEPLGWQNQLSTDVVINYNLKLEKGIIEKSYFNFNCFVSPKVGTLFTDLALGLNYRLGILSPYFTSLGLELNPERKFKIYTMGSASLKAVGYNATLQGGLTNSGNVYELPDASVSRLVASVAAGLVVAYKHVSLEFSKAYITPEFNGGANHSWGKCALTICF